MQTFILAGLVLAHGIGHLLFLAPAAGIASWAGQTGQSWILTPAIGDGPARAVATLVWVATIALFVAGVAGFVTDQAWWRPITVAAAIVSIAGIVIFWDGLAMPSAIFALAFDIVVLFATLIARWPASEPAGA